MLGPVGQFILLQMCQQHKEVEDQDAATNDWFSIVIFVNISTVLAGGEEGKGQNRE